MRKIRPGAVIAILTASLILLCLVLAGLFYFGILHLNNPGSKYPVRGVDVSSYQGDIDWDVLASQNIDYAYIKATEGSSHVDRCFSYNWENASRQDIRIGAYHFFSFESAGKTQAELFCNNVTPVKNMLPPVIDVEFYGRFTSADDIDVDEVASQLRVMVDELASYYGVKPVIYVSDKTYETIVRGNFDDCNLWYRSVYLSVPDDINWTFWQFSSRHRLKGYNGTETYIDMNVFRGTADDFYKF